MKKVTLPIAEESFPSNLLRPTPVSMSLLNCEIYQRGRVSRVADTELLLLIVHLNPNTRFNSWCRMSQAQRVGECLGLLTRNSYQRSYTSIRPPGLIPGVG